MAAKFKYSSLEFETWGIFIRPLTRTIAPSLTVWPIDEISTRRVDGVDEAPR